MRIVGVVEIAAGLLVAIAPRVGGYVVAAWLAGIIVNLLTLPGFYDIALRDFGLLVGALALARLAQGQHHRGLGVSSIDRTQPAALEVKVRLEAPDSWRIG